MQGVINAVVIDNNIHDIIGITTALAELGISTLPVHYSDPTSAFAMCTEVSKVSPRVIITDIQLRDQGTTPTTSDLSNVATCLARIVENTEGPYVVLAWTSKPEAFDDLQRRVIEYFERADIRTPMYFDSICKSQCQTSANEYSAKKILQRFRAHLEGQAAMRALMHWECSVLYAAIESVNTLASADNSALAGELKSLAVSVAGSNLRGFEATAINEAFTYVLKDKLGLLSLIENTRKIWDQLFSEVDASMQEASKHRLNTILHVERDPQNEIVCPGDVWIANKPKELFKMVEIGSEANNQVERMKNEFLTLVSEGHVLNDKIKQETDGGIKEKLKEEYSEKYAIPLNNAKKQCAITMIEISPTCDFANKKKPLKTVSFGVLIPVSAIQQGIKIKQSHSSIILKLIYNNQDHLLGFSSKYITALSEKLIRRDDLQLQKILRIRESLLQSWIHKFSAYNSRIGTVSFD